MRMSCTFCCFGWDWLQSDWVLTHFPFLLGFPFRSFYSTDAIQRNVKFIFYISSIFTSLPSALTIPLSLPSCSVICNNLPDGCFVWMRHVWLSISFYLGLMAFCCSFIHMIECIYFHYIPSCMIYILDSWSWYQ